MLIKNQTLLNNFIESLLSLIDNKQSELYELSKMITVDTDYWISEDFKTVRLILNNYLNNLYCDKSIISRKPKGKILIILSYNEPLTMSIIPILAALVMGNEVVLKPSQKNKKIIKIIWKESGLIEKYKLNLKIIYPKSHRDLSNFIKKVQAVYFFGSYAVAQKIAKLCGENYVEFYPEIETSDVKIFNRRASNIEEDVKQTLIESMSHSGQSCQRIHGIFIHKSQYIDYTKTLNDVFSKMCHLKKINKYISHDYIKNNKLYKPLLRDIKQSGVKKIIKYDKKPLIFFQPKIGCDLINNAYFLPTLWVHSYTSAEGLIKILNNRKFFLGINIQSDDDAFNQNLVNNTKFTRFTINTTHINIRPWEGWGGTWPSGFGGYSSWFKQFSEKYILINNNHHEKTKDYDYYRNKYRRKN